MGRVAWRLSKSWPLRKACASLTPTKSTATQGRSTLTASWGNFENDFPKPAWWCASARAWQSEASWWPWGGWGCSGSSSSLAGMPVFLLYIPLKSRPTPGKRLLLSEVPWCHPGNHEELDHMPVAPNKNALWHSVIGISVTNVRL